MEITVVGPLLDQATVCEPILRALPEWFGIEEATRQYVEDIQVRPTFVASVADQVLGFTSLTLHNEYAAEIHVMGVCPEWHGQGVGGAMVREAEAYLRRQVVEYLQVKTLSPAHPDEGYARTREFYRAMGFRPLEEFPELWGPANPCLQMIKRL